MDRVLSRHKEDGEAKENMNFKKVIFHVSRYENQFRAKSATTGEPLGMRSNSFDLFIYSFISVISGRCKNLRRYNC